MTDYENCLVTEDIGQGIIRDWLKSMGCTVVFNRNDGRDAEFQSYGDLIVKRPNSIKHELVELKIEQTNKHGNLFIETWSNKSWFNPGWIYKSKADLLFYYFLEQDELYTMSMVDLKKFVFKVNDQKQLMAFGKYKERQQSKHSQPNLTCGLCVPIPDLLQQPGLLRQHSPKASMSIAA
jgi:hypothetical protein